MNCESTHMFFNLLKKFYFFFLYYFILLYILELNNEIHKTFVTVLYNDCCATNNISKNIF